MGRCLVWGLLLGGWLLAQSGMAASPPAGTLIVSESVVSYTNTFGAEFALVAATATTEVSNAVALSVALAGIPSWVQAGDTLRYTVVAANGGSLDATGVLLSVQLPPEAGFVTATGGGLYDAASRQVRWSIGDLPAGASIPQVVETQVSADVAMLPIGMEIPATATLTAAGDLEVSDLAIVRVGRRTDLVAVKSVDSAQVPPGGELRYDISVRNDGNLASLNTLIVDMLPDGVELIAGPVDLPFTIAGQRLEIQAGDLASGAAITTGFGVRVAGTAADGMELRNQAQVSAAGVEPVWSNEVVSVVGDDGPLVLAGSSVPGQIHPGANLVYVLTLRNTGDTDANLLTLRQALPADTRFVAIDAAGQFSDGVAQWDIDTLAVGETRELRWEVQSSREIPPGSVLLAPATLEHDGVTVASIEIRTTILEQLPVAAAFFDQSFAQERTVYFAGDTAVYVQVSDGVANRDNAVLDTVRVAVRSAGTAPAPPAPLAPALTVSDTELVVLTETAPASGLFQGQLPFDLSVANANDGSLFVTANQSLFLGYFDSDGNPLVSESEAIYQPALAVFNSATGEVVPAATVRVLNADGTAASFVDGSSNVLVTDSRGEVFFPELSVPAQQSVALMLEVIPPPGAELEFPSAVPDAELPPELSTGKATQFGAGARGEVFAVAAASPYLGVDVPLDPPAGMLRVDKLSDDGLVGVGEIVSYVIVVTNSGQTAVTGVQLLDTPPREFRYLEGSSQVAGAAVLEPVFDGARLSWDLGTVGAGERIELRYRMMVGVDARDGDYANAALATGSNELGAVTSNTSVFRVRVTEGLFTRNGTVLGRVFVDFDADGIIDADEPGVGSAIVLMQDGSYVISDDQGRFTFRNLDPGQHVLRLDRSSLPLNLRPGGAGGHFMDRSDSQWIEMYASGLVKANFPTVPVTAVAQAELRAAMQLAAAEDPAAGVTPAGVMPVSSVPAATDTEPTLKGVEARAAMLQELAATLTSPELDFVNLVDGQQLPGVHADIRVKFPSGGRLEALLNGAPIAASQLGTIVENPDRGITLHEYAAVRLSEGAPNTLTLRFSDPFGNLRGSREIRVYTLSDAASINFEVGGDGEPVADGMSVVPVTATVLNTLGNPALQLGMVTIDARPARILEADADPANPGHQLRLADGVARFSLRAPRQPGDSTIRILADAVEGELTLRFAPQLSNLMLIGSGDLVLGSGSVDAPDRQPPNVFGDDIEDGFGADGKLAVFASGAISDRTLLTATYDSARERPEDFFYAREQQVDEESIPVITGDGSEAGYSGSSRDKLFLRLDRDESHLLWGDFWTGLGQGGLSAYARTFTGLHTEVREERYRITGFAAEMLQDRIVDALAANGTSGYYFLSRRLIVPGSERVLLQTRDRLRPDRVLRSEPLQRLTDYDIDYDRGSLLMRSPLPTYDEALNPNVLVVSYEVDNESNDQWAWGARLEFDILARLTLGATGVVEESTIDDYGLRGIDLSWHEAHSNTQFTAEYVESQAVVAVDGPLHAVNGSGVRLGFEGAPREQFSYQGYYQDVDALFVNPSALDMRPGTRNYGAEASYQLGASASLFVEGYREDDQVLNNEFSHIATGWRGMLNQFDLSAEIYSDDFDSETLPSTLSDVGQSANSEANAATSRYPFDSTAEQMSQDLGVRVSAGRQITEKFGFNLSHAQDVRNTDQSLSYARLNYDLGQDRTLYYIQRYDRLEDRSETRRLAGVETTVAYNTTSFVEYGMAETLTGDQLRRSIGLRNLFQFGAGFFGNASYEQLDTVVGEPGASRPDGYAATVAATWVPSDRWRLTARVENRDEDERETWLREVGVATEIGRDFSLVGRARYYLTESDQAERRDDFRTSLGLGWRPTRNDRLQLIARLDWWQQDRPVGIGAYEEQDKRYGSIEGIYQFSDRFSLSARYAGKLYQLAPHELYTDLVAARGVYLLTDNLELGVTARLLNEHEFDSRTLGGAVDVGYNVWKSLWVTAGYSFDDFDEHLRGDGYSGQGAYVKLRFKFDENTLQSLLGN